MRCRSALLLTFLSGCFNPDPAKIVISCEPANPECPPGQACVEGRCTAPSDGAVADQGVPDLATTDSGTADDLATGTGCAAAGGTNLGAAYACPGTFSSGGARSLCAAGYKICTSATGINVVTCATLAGFFAADVPAYWTGAVTNETCGRTTGSNALWYGCGNGSGSSMVRDGVKLCGGFPRLIECKGTWACTSMHTIETTANTATKDGVLCCPQ